MALPHTIHFHGLDVDQQNDGVPATSFSVSQGSYTYNFTAPHAGTYQYHCHVDTHQHYEMGMFGTVIIRPSDGNTTNIWDGGPAFDKEYIWQLTTFDSTWHAGQGGGALEETRIIYGKHRQIAVVPNKDNPGHIPPGDILFPQFNVSAIADVVSVSKDFVASNNKSRT